MYILILLLVGVYCPICFGVVITTIHPSWASMTQSWTTHLAILTTQSTDSNQSDMNLYSRNNSLIEPRRWIALVGTSSRSCPMFKRMYWSDRSNLVAPQWWGNTLKYTKNDQFLRRASSCLFYLIGTKKIVWLPQPLWHILTIQKNLSYFFEFMISSLPASMTTSH